MLFDRGSEAVGIDLGTTFSSLAFLDAQMTPRMVPDSSGKPVIPSAIYFDESGEIVVGELAVEQARVAAERVIQFVKVHMGDEWRKDIDGHVHTPESLSAIILSHLVSEAEPQIGVIERAVITVPAYFTERRRRATEQAGQIAGLDVIGTLNEPMAATLAYGLYMDEKEQNVLVYDLGGGTFDVTIVRISPGEIEEIATNGNRQLGGRDWDACLIDFVSEEFRTAHGRDPRNDPQAAQDLQLECERAKRRLGRMAKTAVRLHAFGNDHVTEITREQFETMTQPLVQSTKLTTELVLEDAKLEWRDLSRIALVGGSTQLPAVRSMLRNASGLQPDTGVNPVIAVALGAAIYAHMLESGTEVHTIRRPVAEDTPEDAEGAPLDLPTFGESQPTGEGESAGISRPRIRNLTLTYENQEDDPRLADFAADQTASGEPPDLQRQPEESREQPVFGAVPTVRFVTAHGVGVRVRSGDQWKNSVLIPRNAPVPTSATRRYFTAEATTAETHINVEITQGDSPDVELAEHLGTGRIEGFPWNEPARQPVDVTMEFDEEGRLHVTAIYANTGQTMEMSLDVVGGLQPEEIEEHRDFLRETGVLKVFDPDTALGGLDAGDDDEDELELDLGLS